MILMTRIDPARHMARFYRIAIEPDLFGGVRLVRQWGRIGATGWQQKAEHFADEHQAEHQRHRIERAKRQRGYASESDRLSLAHVRLQSDHAIAC